MEEEKTENKSKPKSVFFLWFEDNKEYYHKKYQAANKS